MYGTGTTYSTVLVPVHCRLTGLDTHVTMVFIKACLLGGDGPGLQPGGPGRL